ARGGPARARADAADQVPRLLRCAQGHGRRHGGARRLRLCRGIRRGPPGARRAPGLDLGRHQQHRGAGCAARHPEDGCAGRAAPPRRRAAARGRAVRSRAGRCPGARAGRRLRAGAPCGPRGPSRPGAPGGVGAVPRRVAGGAALGSPGPRPGQPRRAGRPGLAPSPDAARPLRPARRRGRGLPRPAGRRPVALAAAAPGTIAFTTAHPTRATRASLRPHPGETLMQRRIFCLAMAGAALLAAAPVPAAEAFPDRPVTLVVPFPPGGPTDALARRLADGLKDQLKQTVVVENRGGAGGNIGAEHVANATPDGYTILFGTSGPLAINVSLYRNQQYDPQKSFAPVIRIGHLPNILVVHPSLPVHNAQELIAYAKQHPDRLSYASSGNGASSHLAGILFNKMAGTNILHVPYKGTGPALNDLLGGQVSMSFTDI